MTLQELCTCKLYPDCRKDHSLYCIGPILLHCGIYNSVSGKSCIQEQLLYRKHFTHLEWHIAFGSVSNIRLDSSFINTLSKVMIMCFHIMIIPIPSDISIKAWLYIFHFLLSFLIHQNVPRIIFEYHVLIARYISGLHFPNV